MAKKEIKLTKKEEVVVEKKLRQRLYERAKNSAGDFGKEFKKHSLTAITAAFGFLIALSWREPIADYVNFLIAKMGVSEGGLIGYKVLSAVIVTLVGVLALMVVARWATEKKV